MKLREDTHIQDKLGITRMDEGGNTLVRQIVPGTPPVASPMQVRSNIKLSLVDPRTGEVVEQRESHNIFLDYGRDWLAHLISIDAAGAYFRSDRIKYMAVGIGGTNQIVASADIRNPAVYNYPGFPNDWAGGVGTGDPSQAHTNPSITALEWPVEIVTGEYYDLISQPATFPETGVVRYTAVLGVNEVSFGAATTVPLSEIGLFTEQIDTQTGGLATPPLVWAGQPVVEKSMVAYNQFSTLSKTNDFVLQIDWELRFR